VWAFVLSVPQRLLAPIAGELGAAGGAGSASQLVATGLATATMAGAVAAGPQLVDPAPPQGSPDTLASAVAPGGGESGSQVDPGRGEGRGNIRGGGDGAVQGDGADGLRGGGGATDGGSTTTPPGGSGGESSGGGGGAADPAPTGTGSDSGAGSGTGTGSGGTVGGTVDQVTGTVGGTVDNVGNTVNGTVGTVTGAVGGLLNGLKPPKN
jgi:hypothetical protein